MSRPTVSRSVCLGIQHPSEAYDQIFISVTQLRVCWCGVLSLARGRVCHFSHSLVRVLWETPPPHVILGSWFNYRIDTTISNSSCIIPRLFVAAGKCNNFVVCRCLPTDYSESIGFRKNVCYFHGEPLSSSELLQLSGVMSQYFLKIFGLNPKYQISRKSD
jgi:hypothetical protein